MVAAGCFAVRVEVVVVMRAVTGLAGLVGFWDFEGGGAGKRYVEEGDGEAAGVGYGIGAG